MTGTMAEKSAVSDNISHMDLLQRLQIAIGPLVLMLIFYFGYSYLTHETTIKRSLYEAVISPISRLLRRSIQHPVFGISGPFPNRGGEHENSQGSRGSLQTTYAGQGISSVVQRARTLSGIDKFITPNPESTFPGLGNWDNSCFQNSVLQGLASLPAFKESVETNWRACVAAEIDAPALEGLQVFVDQLQQEQQGRHTLWPPSVLRSMNTWQQQDAQEYLSKILDSIEKETTRTQKVVTKRSAAGLGCLRSDVNTVSQADNGRSIAETLSPSSLEGFLSQKLRCQRCGFSEGISLTSFNCLTLNLGLGGGRYLEALLDTHFEPEMIDGVECDECTRLAKDSSHSDHSRTVNVEHEGSGKQPSIPTKEVKTLSTKMKHILFGRLPQNLALHINRSIFDDWGNQRKNQSFVEFPMQLKIWSDWVEELGDDDMEVHAIYELRCIINHSGRHDNGHYVTCGKRGKDWFLFNDEIVTKITEADVLTRGNVFMLFYEKLDCDPIKRVSTPQSSDTPAAETPSPSSSSYVDTAADPSAVSQDSSGIVESTEAA